MITILTKLASTVANRLLNKYTTKSVGFFGVVWLIYASFTNVSTEHAQFIAFAISNVSLNNLQESLSILNSVALFIVLLWLLYLAIDNLFRKSVSEPTIIMLLLIKLFKINKDNK